MAITNPDGNNASLPFTGAGGSVVMNNACAPNDLIHAVAQFLNADFNAPPTLSDSVNAGNYTFIGAFFDATNHFLIAHYYKIANATGTPTISTGSVAAVGSGAGGKVAAARYTGFVGTPTLDASCVLGANGTGTAIAGPALVTTKTPELLVGAACLEANPTASGNNWTQNAAAANGQCFYSYNVITGAIGTTSQWTYTGSASSIWGILNAGLYGAVPVPPRDPARVEIAIYAASSDGLFHCRYPLGNAPLLTITPSAAIVPDAVVGVPWEVKFNANGTGPWTWTHPSGDPWMSIDSTGLASGTPTAPGPDPNVIKVVDSLGATGTLTF
jgi:hypothetical protein